MATPLATYYDALATHDWWYEMSDDNSKFVAGDREHKRLERISRESPDHKKLWHAMMIYRKHGEGDAPARPPA
jgi:hypothetical protein